VRILDALGELLGTDQGAAGCLVGGVNGSCSSSEYLGLHTNCDGNSSIAEDIEGRPCHEARSEHKHLAKSGKSCQRLESDMVWYI
jgi:hypothetical protein